MSEATVLLVEDNEDDVFLMRRLFQKEAIPGHLQVVTDGKQAMKYLGGEEKYADRSLFPLPNLIFLDIKLPFLNGFDVLAWMREQRELSTLPVVVLSSSLEDRDREKALHLGSLYRIKPPTPKMIQEVMRIANFRNE